MKNRSNEIEHDGSATFKLQSRPKKEGAKTLKTIPWYHLDFNRRHPYPSACSETNIFGGSNGPGLIESVCLADSDIEDCLATSRSPTLFDEHLKSL